MKKKIKIIFIVIKFLFLFINISLRRINHKKTIGVVGLINHNNIGNNLVKFAMYTKLKEFGFYPKLIGTTHKAGNIYFLRKYVKLKEVNKTFSGLNENDYDILMVNSDQTWNGEFKELLNIGFLKFAENWKTKRFVYGASLGYDYWKYNKTFDIIARNLLKKFSGISVREKNAIKLVEKHLKIKPQLVLDPTMLIDKKYYLNLIKVIKILNSKINIFVFIN